MIEILIVYLWEKFEKKYVSKFMHNILRNSMKKIDFCNMFRKLNTSTEHDLEFLMVLKGNSFQNVIFFRKNPQKKLTFFCQKFRDLHFLSHSI